MHLFIYITYDFRPLKDFLSKHIKLLLDMEHLKAGVHWFLDESGHPKVNDWLIAFSADGFPRNDLTSSTEGVVQILNMHGLVNSVRWTHVLFGVDDHEGGIYTNECLKTIGAAIDDITENGISIDVNGVMQSHTFRFLSKADLAFWAKLCKMGNASSRYFSVWYDVCKMTGNVMDARVIERPSDNEVAEALKRSGSFYFRHDYKSIVRKCRDTYLQETKLRWRLANKRNGLIGDRVNGNNTYKHFAVSREVR
jgi:hypothetical protein